MPLEATLTGSTRRNFHGAGPASPRVALITGASAGIGRELAREFARHGHRVVLVARREAKLDDVANKLRADFDADVEVIAQDLSADGAAEALCAELRARRIHVDILVNNAGFAIQGEFSQTDPQAQLRLLRVNVLTLTHLVRQFLPAMIERGWGRVLNVASIGAFMPGPLTATYFASKAFVVSFSEALAHELRGSGVTVTTLCPGPTDTGFARQAGLIGSKAFSTHLMDPADVAQTGYTSTMKGHGVVAPGFRNHMRMLVVRWVPRRLLAHFSRKYHDVPSRRETAVPVSVGGEAVVAGVEAPPLDLGMLGSNVGEIAQAALGNGGNRSTVRSGAAVLGTAVMTEGVSTGTSHADDNSNNSGAANEGSSSARRQGLRRVAVPGLQDDLDGRRYRNGEQDPDDPEQHAPHEEGEEDRHRMQRHRLA
jgi:hypothetical protein